MIRQPLPDFFQRAALSPRPVPTGIPGADPGTNYGARITQPSAQQAGGFPAAASRGPAAAPGFYGSAVPSSPVPTGIPGADPAANHGPRFTQPAAQQAGAFPAAGASRSPAAAPGFLGGSTAICQPPPGFPQRATLPSSPVPTGIPGADPGADRGARFTQPTAPQAGGFPAIAATCSPAPAPGFQGGSAVIRQAPPGFFQLAALSPSSVPTGIPAADPGANYGAGFTHPAAPQAVVFPAAAASRSGTSGPSFQAGSAVIRQPPVAFSQRPAVRPSTLPLKIIQASAYLNKEPQMTHQQSCQDQVGRGATNKAQVSKHLRLLIFALEFRLPISSFICF